jgi:hypothetical protein
VTEAWGRCASSRITLLTAMPSQANQPSGRYHQLCGRCIYMNGRAAGSWHAPSAGAPPGPPSWGVRSVGTPAEAAGRPGPPGRAAPHQPPRSRGIMDAQQSPRAGRPQGARTLLVSCHIAMAVSPHAPPALSKWDLSLWKRHSRLVNRSPLGCPCSSPCSTDKRARAWDQGISTGRGIGGVWASYRASSPLGGPT